MPIVNRKVLWQIQLGYPLEDLLAGERLLSCHRRDREIPDKADPSSGWPVGRRVRHGAPQLSTVSKKDGKFEDF